MTGRVLGLAVGIARYPRSSGLGRVSGADTEARRFRDLLLSVAGADADDVILCTAPARKGHRDAKRSTIVEALNTLIVRCNDNGGTVVVYLSGHGCSVEFPDADGVAGVGRSETVLFAADYTGPNSTPGLRVDAMRTVLRAGTGPGTHFWFVNTCRNPEVVDGGIIQGSRRSLKKGTPNVHRLFAAVDGGVATTRSPFPSAVVKALRGEEGAIAWDGTAYRVTFARLCKAVEAHVPTSTLEADPGPPPDALWPVDDVEDVRVRLEVQGAPARGRGTLKYTPAGGDTVEQEVSGRPKALSLRPNEYRFTLEWGGRVHAPSAPTPNPVDCYSSTTVTFDIGQVEPAAGSVRLRAPEAGRRDLAVGALTEAMEAVGEEGVTFDRDVRVRLRDAGVPLLPVELHRPWSGAGGRMVASDIEAVDLLDESTIALAVRQYAAARREMPPDRAVPYEILVTGDGSVEPDPDGIQMTDPASWLSVVGAAAIAGTDPYPTLTEPFPSFDGLTAAQAGISVLVPAGAAGSVHLGDRELVLAAHDHLDGTRAGSAADIAIGSQTLWLDLPGLAVGALAVHPLPGRVTLVVVTGGGPQGVRHYMVEPGHLAVDVDPFDVVDEVRFAAFVQHQYAHDLDVEQELSGPGRARWERVVSSVSLDPVTAAVAAWGQARRVGTDAIADSVPELASAWADRLGRPFVDLERLVRIARDQPVGDEPALLLDATLAAPSEIPTPDGLALDLRGPWTAWTQWRSTGRIGGPG